MAEFLSWVILSMTFGFGFYWIISYVFLRIGFYFHVGTVGIEFLRLWLKPLFIINFLWFVVIEIVFSLVYWTSFLLLKILPYVGQEKKVEFIKTMINRRGWYAKVQKTGKIPLWTNGMFSGMPAYMIKGNSNNLAPWYFIDIISLHLPRPIQFFFLACVCFYFLSQVLSVRNWIGVAGALCYAYATYNAVIVAEGH